MNTLHIRPELRTAKNQPLPLRPACTISEEIVPANLPSLDELAREGARQLIVRALEVEVTHYIERMKSERDESGRALVVRNGHAEPRKVTIGSGTLEISAPRVNDKRVIDGQRQKFTSSILPPYMRRSAEVAEVLPILYLRGLSTGDFAPALSALLGSKASGLSPSAISRMLEEWQQEYDGFCCSDITEEIVYVWVDGIHSRVRLEEDGICLLVVIGVTTAGKKKLLAVADGYRESKESWADVLRGLNARGMKPPALAVGDGALGFWAAAAETWPRTKAQRCIFHKMANLLDKLPKRKQEAAKEALRAVFFAKSKEKAVKAAASFSRKFSEHVKAVDCLNKDLEVVLTFMAFPSAHWKSLRTTNVIESSFATVRLRTRTTKGAGCRRRSITMAFKLLTQAEARWRLFDAASQLGKVLVKSNQGVNAAA